MQRLQLEVQQNVRQEKGEYIYTVTGNGIKFEQRLKENERTPENMAKMNEIFRNNLRYVAHFGGWPDREHEDPKAMMHELQSKWSTTDTGIAIRPARDPVKQFTPF